MKQRRPMKPSRAAIWNKEKNRWEIPIPIRPAPKNVKRKNEYKTYSKLKAIWRKQPRNYFCAALCRDKRIATPACKYPHHIRGRVGSLLNDVRFWLPVCEQCHQWIEKNRAAARRRGWLASRDAKAIKNEGIKL